MHETWLRANWRPLITVAIPQLLGLCVVLKLAASTELRWFGIVCALPLLFFLALCVTAAVVPVIACDGRSLRFRLGRKPVMVPIEVVEGFLLGQGPSYLPGKEASRSETRTLVVRLAERATEWEHVAMPPRLGSWCGHYITIRGTWCEPLSVDLVNRLNMKLHEAKQQADHDRSRAQPAQVAG